MDVTLEPLDWLLIAVVVIQSTVLAYIPSPRWKSYILILPVPFTVLALALNRPVDATYLAGLLDLVLFAHVVRWLYVGAGLHIFAAIACGEVVYVAVGLGLAHFLGPVALQPMVFWVTAGVVMALGAAIRFSMKPRAEPSHRTRLPVVAKLPIILGVVLVLIVIKHALAGAATTFPLVSTVAMYEGRKSLWTICREIPRLLLAMVPMMAVIHVVQGRWPQWGMYGALAAGWAAYAVAMVALVAWAQWRHDPSDPLGAQAKVE